MASLFAARRKPKRIIREDQGSAEPEADDNGPVVRRPTAGVAKTKSKLRVSFNPGDADADVTDSATSTDVGEKTTQSRPSRLGPSSLLQSRLNQASTSEDAVEHSISKPSYNKAFLDELRNSTPSTPKDLSLYNTPNNELEDTILDVESKFGKSALASANAIPSAAEIKEKKERRARLAKEQHASNSEKGDDFIPLEDYDSDGEFKPQRMQVGTYLSKETDKEDTRLIHDDEDIAEGFDEFVEDTGRVTLSKRGRREQSRRERENIRDMINDAEGHSGPESDSSSLSSDAAERQHAYEVSQTHHGMDGLVAHRNYNRRAKRPRQPKETTAIPRLANGLGRLRERIQAIEFEKARIEKRRADIRKEKEEVLRSQEHIQKSLEEAGRELEMVQAKMRTQHQQQQQADNDNGVNPVMRAEAVNGHGYNHRPGLERGLESFGEAPNTDQMNM